MVKVLYFVDRMLRGGIQTFVYENIRHMSREKVQIDFLLLDDGKCYEMEKELNVLGCNVYKLHGIWINSPIDYIKYYISMDRFFKEHNDYSVVHMHSSSKNFLFIYLAEKYGIKTRIVHSHNIDFQTKSRFRIIVGNLLKPLLIKHATDLFACSDMAGKWLFGNRKFHIINNAVDLEKFMFDSVTANLMRQKLGISDDEIVIGHVGRFSHQKNHAFLIDVFNELHKLNSKFRLLLVGAGELENSIRIKVDKYNIASAVIFAGFQPDSSKFMQAMDLFIFPSSFEGLGLVLIEAQAAGLPCFASKNVIPMEAKVTDLLSFISLDSGAKAWAEIILDYGLKTRISPIDVIRQKGYDIKETADFLQKYYISKAIQNT